MQCTIMISTWDDWISSVYFVRMVVDTFQGRIKTDLHDYQIVRDKACILRDRIAYAKELYSASA